MNQRILSFCFATFFCLGSVLIATDALAQSVVTTLNFNPPGVTNSSGILQEVGVVENTNLVYAAGGSNKAAVIDPNTNAIVAVATFPTSGGIDLARQSNDRNGLHASAQLQYRRD